ncbi:hypothetical protein ACMA1D_14670 [Streptomyces sp. 796.1]|uniref:hypothetical protein n=1 Tax=Streptomyces sp. 796.1 TaxID=3163029 RepID=UPI0039C94D7A
MTAPALHFADAREAADLAAFLARLIHYDRAAAVRVQATGAGAAPRAGGVLAVFGRPASFEVLAIRTATLTPGPAAPPTGSGPVGSGPAGSGTGASAGAAEAAVDGASGEWDRTVSAGQFADAIDEARQRAGAGRADGPTGLTVYAPEPVTGPPWAGVLPPRGGWQRVPGLPDPAAVRAMVAAAVAEFRARDEALAPEQRTRAERDRIGREIWSRTVGDTQLPLRALHAAQAVGFLRFARPGVAEAGRPQPSVLAAAGVAAAAHGPDAEPGTGTGRVSTSGIGAGPSSGTGADVDSGSSSGSGGSSGAAGVGDSALVLFAARGWLRLRTPYGSIAVRTGGLSGLSVTPA